MNFPTPSPTWSLHPQLARDTIELGDLPLSRVLVDQRRQLALAAAGAAPPDVAEIIDLDEVEQAH